MDGLSCTYYKTNFTYSCYLAVRVEILGWFKLHSFSLFLLHFVKKPTCLSVKASCKGVGRLVFSLVSMARTDEILGLSSANS